MMKKTKKGFKSLAILLALVLAIGFSPATNVSAKTAPRLNYKKVTIVQGKKKRLKVKGTKRKVKWSSTKKSVVTVNKKGVIKAKKKGKATIIAKVGKKKLRCKVTVKKKPAKKKSSKKTSKKSTSSERKQLAYYAGALYFPGALKVGEKVDLINYNSDYNINKKYKISNSVRAKYFKWYVKDKSILTINKYGIATGKKVGTTKVSCRYMTEEGTWRTTRTATAEVKEVGDVKISYTTSSSTGDKNTFDTVTCTVKNNSSSAIEFDRHIYVNDGTGWRFTNDTDKLIPLNSGESTTIVYRITDTYDKFSGKYFPYAGYSYNNPWTIEFGYKLHGKWVSPVHHIRGGEYWATK